MTRHVRAAQTMRRTCALAAAIACLSIAPPCLAADRIDADAYVAGAALGGTLGGLFGFFWAYEELDNPYKEIGGVGAFFVGGAVGALAGLAVAGVLDLTIDGAGGALFPEERSSALMPMPPTATLQLRW